MKAILALLFLAAISVFVQAEWASEFHPQAMLEYVRGEDHEMKRQLYHLVKMDNGFETSFKREFQPSVRPSIQPGLLRCVVQFKRCKNAADSACEELGCLKQFGLCLKSADYEPSEEVKKCFPIIPCCMLISKSCEEKLCCVTRFGECVYKLHIGKLQ